jgi:hypothetical protein
MARAPVDFEFHRMRATMRASGNYWRFTEKDELLLVQIRPLDLSLVADHCSAGNAEETGPASELQPHHS